MLRRKNGTSEVTANAEIITLQTITNHRDMDRQTAWGKSARPTSNNLHPRLPKLPKQACCKGSYNGLGIIDSIIL